MKIKTISLFYLFFILLISCKASDNGKHIRKSVVAGTFYAKNSSELKSTISKYLKSVSKKDKKNDLIGLIVPHAGYEYSGQVAAYAYKMIENKKINTVILLGVSHRYPLQRVSMYMKGYYNTPLGKIKINNVIAKKIKKEYPHIQFIPDAHKYEHSLEVQLPFLQTVLKNDFKIVPILIGQINKDILNNLSKALAKIISEDEDIIIISSTDLSHFTDYKNAVKVDKETIKLIQDLNSTELINKEHKIQSRKIPNLVTYQCGLGAVTVMIETAKLFKDPEISLLNYRNSGDVTLSKKRVVGYTAMAVTSKKENLSDKPENEFSLSEDEKKFLLKIARETLETYVKKKKRPEFKIKYDILLKKAGAFVTLNKNHNLRGCIGYIAPIKPLYETVIDNAINSCSKDHRFPPVTETELKDIKIEISVLTPPLPVKSYKDIIIGKHGIILKKGFHQSVFLPQVATEQGWDIDTTLTHLSVKAGMGYNDWKKGASFEVFTAIVFHE